MNKWHTIKLIARRREIARIRANRRWQLDRERRDKLAEADPIKFLGSIVARNVFIDERTGKATETVFYDFDSERDWKRKLRHVRLTRTSLDTFK